MQGADECLGVSTGPTTVTFTTTVHVNGSVNIWINELVSHSDAQNCGLEVVGPASTDLSSYSVEVYSINGAKLGSFPFADTDKIPDLTADIQDPSKTFGAVWLKLHVTQFDGVALIKDDKVTQALSLGAQELTATEGTAKGRTFDQVQNFGEFYPTMNGDDPGKSLQLKGTGTSYGDFDWKASTCERSEGLINSLQHL